MEILKTRNTARLRQKGSNKTKKITRGEKGGERMQRCAVTRRKEENDEETRAEEKS